MSNFKVGTAWPFAFDIFKDCMGAKLIGRAEDVVESDIIIFPGGEDICPILYGESTINASGINYQRDAFEEYIFKIAQEHKKKILGICRGHQLVNVLLGGSLYQDIYSDLKLRHSHALGIMWKVDSLARQLRGGNSMHHQAVKKVGTGLKIIGTTKDGIIEACKSNDNRIVTFQFHPEFMGIGIDYLANVARTGELA